MWKHEKLRFLRAPTDKTLKLPSGEEVTSLEELSQYFYRCDPESFAPMVSEGQNAFADWVDDAFGLTDLVYTLRRNPTPLKMMVYLEAYLRDIDPQAPKQPVPPSVRG